MHTYHWNRQHRAQARHTTPNISCCFLVAKSLNPKKIQSPSMYSVRMTSPDQFCDAPIPNIDYHYQPFSPPVAMIHPYQSWGRPIPTYMSSVPHILSERLTCPYQSWDRPIPTYISNPPHHVDSSFSYFSNR